MRACRNAIEFNSAPVLRCAPGGLGNVGLCVTLAVPPGLEAPGARQPPPRPAPRTPRARAGGRRGTCSAACEIVAGPPRGGEIVAGPPRGGRSTSPGSKRSSHTGPSSTVSVQARAPCPAPRRRRARTPTPPPPAIPCRAGRLEGAPPLPVALRRPASGRLKRRGGQGGGALFCSGWRRRAGAPPPPTLPRTNRTSLVPPLVLSGHAASLTAQAARETRLGAPAGSRRCGRRRAGRRRTACSLW